ncbi:hypothetical protein E2C01_088208 [Portunus trituberculatus]|uniref:Uncharacterized protein n=1 Tax=Portunus trituberculatus TaxID=210409 RepID=A0A5B7J5I4_PORTR|nr:hypothetical protein [Portunus trituberculatus]
MWSEEVDEESRGDEAADKEDGEEPHDRATHEAAALLPEGHHVRVRGVNIHRHHVTASRHAAASASAAAGVEAGGAKWRLYGRGMSSERWSQGTEMKHSGLANNGANAELSVTWWLGITRT